MRFRYLDSFRPDKLFTSSEFEQVAFVGGYTREPDIVCALLFEVRNAALDPRHDFTVSFDSHTEAEEAAAQLGLDLVGLLHSHPVGSVDPTERDIEGCPRGYVGGMFHVIAQKLTWYDAEGHVWQGRWKAPLGAARGALTSNG